MEYSAPSLVLTGCKAVINYIYIPEQAMLCGLKHKYAVSMELGMG